MRQTTPAPSQKSMMEPSESQIMVLKKPERCTNSCVHRSRVLILETVWGHKVLFWSEFDKLRLTEPTLVSLSQMCLKKTLSDSQNYWGWQNRETKFIFCMALIKSPILCVYTHTHLYIHTHISKASVPLLLVYVSQCQLLRRWLGWGCRRGHFWFAEL